MFTALRKSVVVLAITDVTDAAVAFDATAQGLLLRFTDTVRAYGTDEWPHLVEAGYYRLEVEGTATRTWTAGFTTGMAT
jgi:hypothetical protein